MFTGGEALQSVTNGFVNANNTQYVSPLPFHMHIGVCEDKTHKPDLQMQYNSFFKEHTVCVFVYSDRSIKYSIS